MHAIDDALNSALSHPNDPSAIEKDMETIQPMLGNLLDSPAGTKAKAQLAADQALALMEQLQKDASLPEQRSFSKG